MDYKVKPNRREMITPPYKTKSKAAGQGKGSRPTALLYGINEHQKLWSSAAR